MIAIKSFLHIWKNPFYCELPALPAIQTSRRQFLAQYGANKAEWDAALRFLKDSDLAALEPGRHEISSNGTYAMVQDYTTKAEGEFEQHEDYIDIQYVVKGEEYVKIDKKTLFGRKQYDIYLNNQSYCIIFPNEAHMPGLVADDEACDVRKVVVKVPYIK